jgi:fucose permease
MVGRVASSRLLLGVSGHTVVAASALGSAVGVGLLLVATGEAVATAAVVITGLSFASIFPTTLGVAGGRFAAYSGTAFGILFAIAMTGGMTLTWAVGQLAEAYGLRPALALAGVNSLMILVLQLILRRAERAARKEDVVGSEVA